MAKQKNEKERVIRLSIQVSETQFFLLNTFINEEFSKDGIFLTVSQVIRHALGKFLKEQLKELNEI